MGEDGWKQGEQPRGQQRGRISEMMPGPEIDHQARQQEERQDSEPRQKQGAAGMAGVAKDGIAFPLGVGLADGPRAIQVRSQRRHRARQRRMLGFIPVDMPGQVLEAASQVRRLIAHVGKRGIGGHNPNGGNGDEAESQGE